MTQEMEKKEILIALDMFHRLNTILINLPEEFDNDVRADIEYGIYKTLMQIQTYSYREFPLR
jgi:hypothetical protein